MRLEASAHQRVSGRRPRPSVQYTMNVTALGGTEIRYASSAAFRGIAERAARGRRSLQGGDRAPGARGGRVAAGRDPRRPGARAGDGRRHRGFLPDLGPHGHPAGPGRAPGRGPARGGVFVGRPDLAEQDPGAVAGAAAVPVRQPGGLDVLGQHPRFGLAVPAAPAGRRAVRAGADGERGPDRRDDQRGRQRLPDVTGRPGRPSVVAGPAELAFRRRAPGPPGHDRGAGGGAVRAGTGLAGQPVMAL